MVDISTFLAQYYQTSIDITLQNSPHNSYTYGSQRICTSTARGVFVPVLLYPAMAWRFAISSIMPWCCRYSGISGRRGRVQSRCQPFQRRLTIRSSEESEKVIPQVWPPGFNRCCGGVSIASPLNSQFIVTSSRLPGTSHFLPDGPKSPGLYGYGLFA